MDELLTQVKKKKELSQLPDSIVRIALEQSDEDVKKARAFLRKYFGVFLTNKVLKTRNEETLTYHTSSKKRDYEEFYEKIFEGITNVGSIIDIGCGANAFSYPKLQKRFGEVVYVGLEASGQLIDSSNEFLAEQNVLDHAKVIHADVLNKEKVLQELEAMPKPQVAFLFQIIDAVEGIKRNYSKELLLTLREACEYIVITNPTVSISGKKGFESKRKWLKDFLEEEFTIVKEFEKFEEKVFVLKRQN